MSGASLFIEIETVAQWACFVRITTHPRPHVWRLVCILLSAASSEALSRETHGLGVEKRKPMKTKKNTTMFSVLVLLAILQRQRPTPKGRLRTTRATS